MRQGKTRHNSRLFRQLQSLESRLLLSAIPTSVGIYRPSNNALHLDINDDRATDQIRLWGVSGDVPVVADFNGDTLADVAVYRPANNLWFIDQRGTAQAAAVYQFGAPGIVPLAGDITGSGQAALCAYFPTTGQWHFDINRDGSTDRMVSFGQSGDVPLLADMNRDGTADLVIYRHGTWFVDTNLDGTVDQIYSFGGFSDHDKPFIADTNGDGIPELGVMTDGIWHLCFNRDGVESQQFSYGGAGDLPVVGDFNRANSLFVNPSGSDSAAGTELAPFKTIGKALTVATAGSHVRVAAGSYAENLYQYATYDRHILGAGAKATKIAPSGSDAILLDRSSMLLENIALISAGSGGRGLADLGSDVELRGVSTAGSNRYGAVSSDYLGVLAHLRAVYSHFDSTLTQAGMQIQNGTIATLLYCSFDANGTTLDASATSDIGGHGLEVLGNSIVEAGWCSFSSNFSGGFYARDTSYTSLHHSILSYNVRANGGIALDAANLDAAFNIFQANGRTRSAATGLNGFECYENCSGTIRFIGNLFKDNTANGLMLNGKNIQVLNNTFDNNIIGLNINGVFVPPVTTEDLVAKMDQRTMATVTGNTFKVPQGASVEEAIFMMGSRGTADIRQNTFINYAAQLSLDVKGWGGTDLTKDWGLGNYNEADIRGANTFNNSPNPLQLSPFSSQHASYLFSAIPTSVGIYRPSSNALHLDINDDRVTDQIRLWGVSGDVPVVADFNGDTLADVAVYRPANNLWFVDLHGTTQATAVYQFGAPGIVPLAGDITGSGQAALCAYFPTTGQWHFDTNRDGSTDRVVSFGQSGDVPLLADMNRDGTADLVIYRHGTWFVDTNLDGVADQIYSFGGFSNSDKPFIADTNADGIPELGVMTDGVWHLCFNRDGVESQQFSYGGAGDLPVVGDFTRTNCIFVSPSGSDGAAGTEMAPFKTIGQALSIAPAYSHIRVAAGTYAENLTQTTTYARHILGAGAKATKIAPLSSDGLVLDRCSTLLENLDLSPLGSGGRGLVVLGSDVEVRGVSTAGSYKLGAITSDYLGSGTKFKAILSHFDEAQSDAGLQIQNGTVATLLYCSFDRNGTALASTTDIGGHGLEVLGNSSVEAGWCSMSSNFGGGFYARDTSYTSLHNSVLAFNGRGSGGIAMNTAHVEVNYNIFQANGRTRSTTAGLNGFETYENYLGVARFIGNIFKDNTANGLKLSGRDIQVLNNTFDNNLIGLSLNGVFIPPITTVIYPSYFTSVTVTGNTFKVPQGATAEEAIYMMGSHATGYIRQNTFTNFASQLSIDVKGWGGTDLTANYGLPYYNSDILSANTFSNSPNPLQISPTRPA